MINKRAAIGMAIVFAIFYFLAGMIAYQFLKVPIAEARTNINCTVPSTSGDMLTCLLLDSIIPYFIIMVLATTGGIITDKAIT